MSTWVSAFRKFGSFFIVLAVAFSMSGAAAFVTPAATAAALTESQIQAIVDLLQSFGAEQTVVANVNASLRGQVLTPAPAPQHIGNQNVKETLKLLRQLREGMSGDDIKLLQTILAADSEVYPEALISGFYGQMTARAVKKFQKKHNLEQAGHVGPMTLRRLNEELDEHPLSTQDSDSDDAEDEHGERRKEHCAIVPPGHLIAPGWLKKHNREKPIVPVCRKVPRGIEKKLATTTVADTVAPVIAAVLASAVSSSTANIMWTTDERSTSKVHYGVASPLVSAAAIMSDASLVSSHSLELSGLTASTTYTFFVESKDAAGNSATSSQQSFVTLP